VTEIQPANTEQAKRPAGRIRSGLAVLAELQADIIGAWQGEDHKALGYPDWTTYVDAEFGSALAILARDRGLMAELSEAGLSTRAVAAVTGIC
jgi:hypothetical protein